MATETDARVEAIVARCQQIEGIHWDNDTVARAEMVAREALSSPAPVGEVVAPKFAPESALTSIAHWARDYKLSSNERLSLIANHPQVRRIVLAASPSPAPQAPPDDLVKRLSRPVVFFAYSAAQVNAERKEAATAIQSLQAALASERERADKMQAVISAVRDRAANGGLRLKTGAASCDAIVEIIDTLKSKKEEGDA